MIVTDFKDFPRTGRILGVDWGARRTGIAVSDETRDFVFVRPPVIAGRGEDSVKKIADMAKIEPVVRIVLGLPLRIDGSESETTKMVRDMVTRLVQNVDLPICLIDESLTSSAASEENNLHNQKDVKEKLDSQSARIILENAIAVIKRS